MKLWFGSKKYSLFNINNYKIDTSKFGSLLHDFENELEQNFASYVGAKYACIANSASSLLELCLAKVVSMCPCRISKCLQIRNTKHDSNSRVQFSA
jgi:hypothetical protein